MKDQSKDIGAIVKVISSPLKLYGAIALVAIVALVPVITTTSGSVQLIALFGLFTLLLLILGIVTYMASLLPDNLGERPRPEANSLPRDFNGQWWQLVRGDSGNAISRVWVRQEGGQISLAGVAYAFDDDEAREVARWHTDAASVVPRAGAHEICYFWSGTVLDPAAPRKRVEGVGRFRFFSAPGGEPSGDGWFTSGDLEEFTPDKMRFVDLRRLSSAEERALAQDDLAQVTALAREAYSAWSRPAVGT